MTPREEQQFQALQVANTVRMARAQLKREIKAGDIKIVDLLREGIPDCMATEKAEKMLCAAPKVGPTNARSLLIKASASPFVQAGALTWRQRSIIAANLELKEKAREIARRDEEQRAERLAAA